MNLEIRQLRYLLALDRYRSFARAAEALSLTQPALSRSLQVLEDGIGARLFDRGRSGVAPTPVGERLIERARRLVGEAQDIERDLQQMLGLEVGLLRIGAGPYPADLTVGEAAGRLIRRHPQLMLDLSVADWTDLTRRVLAGDLDLAVADCELAREDPRLSVEPLPSRPFVFFCRAGHPLAGRARITIADVRAFPLVGAALPARLQQLAVRNDLGLRPHLPEGVTAPEIRVATFDLARHIVLASDAIGGAMPGQIDEAVARGQVVKLPLDLPWLRSNYGIIRLAARTASPAAVAFVEILREVEEEVPGLTF